MDKELEKRGHAFCRYADDANIYVATRTSGERVMTSITGYLSKRLKLTVNQTKSAVDRPWNRSFLSYSMTWHRKPRLTVAKKAVARLKANLKSIFRRGRGKNIRTTIVDATPKLRGWIAYFRHSEVKGIFEELDGWLRRKLRCILWKQWKRTGTRAKNLMRRGIPCSHSMAVGHKRPRPLVELRGRAYEQGCSEILLRPTGAGITHELASPPPMCFMNRRVRIRTHGGVGGRREQSRLLPDHIGSPIRIKPDSMLSALKPPEHA